MSALHSSLDEGMARYRSQNPKSAAAFKSACHYLPGGGTRSSLAVDPFPLYVSNGQGTKLTDLDGHEYVDFVSDFTSGLYGKTQAGLHEEIRKTLEQGIQLGAHTTREQELAELICTRFKSIENVRFTNSGTEATLLALMTAVRYTGRNKILVFGGGYHGTGFSGFGVDEDGVLPGSELQHLASLRAPFDFRVCPYNDIEAAKAKMAEHGNDIAAILVEPMLGAGGCVPGHPDFLAGLRELATEHASILIFDEIQTARLHYSGRQGQLGIMPDLTLLGKFFGGGFAFGAFGGSKEIMAMYDWRCAGSAGHGGTFNNSVLTMAAGAYATKHFLTEVALKSLTRRGDALRKRLADIFEATGAPFKVTGLGSINQLHCTLGGAEGTAGLKILYFQLLEKGYWIAQRGLLALSFEHTDREIEGFLEAVKTSIKQL